MSSMSMVFANRQRRLHVHILMHYLSCANLDISIRAFEIDFYLCLSGELRLIHCSRDVSVGGLETKIIQ